MKDLNLNKLKPSKYNQNLCKAFVKELLLTRYDVEEIYENDIDDEEDYE